MHWSREAKKHATYILLSGKKTDLEYFLKYEEEVIG